MDNLTQRFKANVQHWDNKRLFLEQVPLNYEKPLVTRWMNCKTAYAVTISPRAMTPDKEEELRFYIMGFLANTKYWLVPERDSKQRLHYHGCVKIDQRYFQEKLKGKAFVKLSPKPGKHWIEYCFKEHNKYVEPNTVLMGKV